MPRATLTTRELKNKSTGLDLFVPTFRENKGTLSSTVFYQVVLVSNLSCFKTPSHKDTDVVQYSLEKKLNEFEELRTKVAEEFSGTMLPQITKKSIIINEAVLRERRNSLDHLVKFLSSTKQLATCASLLKFLGVDSLRATKFSRGESHEQNESTKDSEPNSEQLESSTGDVFDNEEPEQDDSELFSQGKTQEENIFEGSSNVPVSMFDQQDMKRELDEADESDFSFIPDAILTKTERVLVIDGEQDNTDLFQIEDVQKLDELLQDTKQKTSTGSTDSKNTFSNENTKDASTIVPTKRKIPQKPKITQKPKLPNKPKVSANNQDSSSDSSSAVKPIHAARTKQKVSTQGFDQNQDLEVENTANQDNLDADDILKYLQDNITTEGEVDLFS